MNCDLCWRRGWGVMGMSRLQGRRFNILMPEPAAVGACEGEGTHRGCPYGLSVENIFLSAEDAEERGEHLF